MLKQAYVDAFFDELEKLGFTPQSSSFQWGGSTYEGGVQTAKPRSNLGKTWDVLTLSRRSSDIPITPKSIK